jgi:hypothetical protein
LGGLQHGILSPAWHHRLEILILQIGGRGVIDPAFLMPILTLSREKLILYDMFSYEVFLPLFFC